MLKRALLSSLLAGPIGCADELLIGSAHVDASSDPTGASSMIDAAGSALDAAAPEADAGAPLDAAGMQSDAGLGTSAADAGAAMDASASSLIAAAQALAGKSWWSVETWATKLPGTQPFSLGFLPVADTAGGSFAAFCPAGCPVLDIRDGGFPSSPRSGTVKTMEVLYGTYTLLDVTDSGTVLGTMYTGEGLIFPLQFPWEGGRRAPLTEIYVDGFFPPHILFRPGS